MSSAAELLVQTARRRELHHSIILHGPAPDALRELAMSVARALNCEGCDDASCASCRKIDRGSHPDIHVIAVDEGKKMISAEQIRAMVGAASLRQESCPRASGTLPNLPGGGHVQSRGLSRSRNEPAAAASPRARHSFRR